MIQMTTIPQAQMMLPAMLAVRTVQSNQVPHQVLHQAHHIMVIHLTITITVVEANNLMAEANNLMVEAKIPVLIVSKVEAILLKLTVKLKKIKAVL